MLNKHRVLNILFSQNTLFIIVNLFVHAINFLRSFVFMRVLDLADLGMISLVQTCIMFIGFMHFGFFQGGYRIIAYKHDESDHVNNIVFSFIGCIGALLIVLALIFPIAGINIIVGNQYLLLSVVAGIFTLASTWLTNTMTVKKMIREINQILTISGIISVVLIALVFVWGIFGGILSIMMQPVVFVTLALLRCKELRPTALCFSMKIIKSIIQLGFVPFCVGIFSILNIQIERWSIAYLLNVEDLGRFYLVFVFSSLFVLIPTSTNYLFFPKIISSYEHGQFPEFYRQSRNYTLVLIVYGVVTLLVTLTLFQPIVDVLFPNHSENTKYVYMLLPGFICNLLYYSVSSILNAWRDFKSLLLSGSIGVAASVIIIFVTAEMGIFTLNTMVIIKNISYILPMLFGAIYIFIHRKKNHSEIMKRILFIGLPYHSYIGAISHEMELMGYKVTFYPVELRKTWQKVLKTISKSAYSSKLDRFLANMVKKERNNKYEYVVILEVHPFPLDIFKRLKVEHPEAKFIFYSWDALSPTVDYTPYLQYFDKAYTFDLDDAQLCGIGYLPLFCMREFQNLPSDDYDYDVYMIGNMVKPARYKAVMAFEKYCKGEGLRFKKYLKCTPVVMLRLLLKGFIPHGLKLRSIKQVEFVNMMQRSKATFDFANHKQTGYTMRFMENLCAERKIITNNKRALSEPFYSPDRIHVFDDLNFDGIKEFLDKPLKQVDAEKFSQFYVQNFVKTLLS